METLNFNDKRYVVIRILNMNVLEDDEVLKFRDYCHAEIVLKRDGKYYFCNEITEVHPIMPEKTPEPITPPKN